MRLACCSPVNARGRWVAMVKNAALEVEEVSAKGHGSLVFFNVQ